MWWSFDWNILQIITEIFIQFIQLRWATEVFIAECVNQFMSPTFCLCFAFTGINFLGMLHHVCDVTYDEKHVDQSELVNVGAQID